MIRPLLVVAVFVVKYFHDKKMEKNPLLVGRGRRREKKITTVVPTRRREKMKSTTTSTRVVIFFTTATTTDYNGPDLLFYLT